jgi:hypothetical protein
VGALALIALVGVALVLTLARQPGSTYRHSDWFQFWAAPRLLLEGADPYDPVVWADIYRREAAPPVASPPPPYRSIYPPWTLVLLLPLGALPIDSAAAIWLVAQLVIVTLSLRTLVALVAAGQRERILLVGFALAFQPLWLMVGGGNLTGFLLGLLVAGTAAVLGRRPGLAGSALAMLAVKLHPFTVAGPALLAVASPRDRGKLATAAVATGIVLVAITVPFGPGLTGEWLRSALDLQATTGSNATAWTLGRVLPGGALMGPLCVVASLAALVVWWRSAEHARMTLIAAAVAISVFAAPHGWSYDQLLLLVPLAVIVRATGALSGPRRAIALGLSAFAAGLLPWALYAIAIASGGEAWSAVTPALFFGLIILTERWSPTGAVPVA